MKFNALWWCEKGTEVSPCIRECGTGSGSMYRHKRNWKADRFKRMQWNVPTYWVALRAYVQCTCKFLFVPAFQTDKTRPKWCHYNVVNRTLKNVPLELKSILVSVFCHSVHFYSPFFYSIDCVLKLLHVWFTIRAGILKHVQPTESR